VRSLSPAASAASVTDQRCSRIRSTSSRRLFGQVRALAWSFIRVLLGTEWLRHLPASKGARMTNVVRNYS
jgi:hypothetical protein